MSTGKIFYDFSQYGEFLEAVSLAPHFSKLCNRKSYQPLLGFLGYDNKVYGLKTATDASSSEFEEKCYLYNEEVVHGDFDSTVVLIYVTKMNILRKDHFGQSPYLFPASSYWCLQFLRLILYRCRWESTFKIRLSFIVTFVLQAYSYTLWSYAKLVPAKRSSSPLNLMFWLDYFG